jgi:hypothetical protein
VSRTAFDPQIHGFAFRNHWVPDEVEGQQLPRLLIDYFKRRRFLGIIGQLLIPPVVRALRGQLKRHLTPYYGLCGGMCFVALDYYRAGLPLPRRLNAEDTPAAGTPLHTAIWERQLDSLVSDAVRFMVWLAILNYVPRGWPFRGGPAWLLERSRREWRALKAAIDAGQPVPIGLVRDTKHVYDNHQVLAIAYDEVDESHITIHVYDPNCPDQASAIHVEFRARVLDGQEACSESSPLRGFFCETYTPVGPTGVSKPPQSQDWVQATSPTP